MATVTIGVGDTKQHTLYNGETLTQQVADFNHDDLDETGAGHAGISYIMKNCLKNTRQMNAGYKHAFNYQIGNDAPVVNDNANHSDANDPLLTNTHEVTAEEAAAGFVDVKSLGQTYLSFIKVTHADGTTATWRFDSKGFYAGTDVATRTGTSWYASDLDIDESNPVYKIGKMMQEAGVEIKNLSLIHI